LTASDANPPGAAFLRALTKDEHDLLVALIRSDPNCADLLRGLWNRRVRDTSADTVFRLTFEPMPNGVPAEQPKIISWNNMRGDVSAYAIFTDKDGVVGNIELKVAPDTFDLIEMKIWKVDYSRVCETPAADSIRLPRSNKNNFDGAYCDEYATCEGCSARLMIYSETVTREQITSLLGFGPTHGRAKGEPFNSRPTSARAKWHMWFYETAALVPSFDIRRHVDHVLERLDGRDEALARLRAEPGISIRVSCTWWSRYGHGGPTLWPRQLRALGDLELALEFEFLDSDA